MSKNHAKKFFKENLSSLSVLGLFLCVYLYKFSFSGDAFIQIFTASFGVFAFFNGRRIEKSLHSKPILKIYAEYQPHDYSKELQERFTHPVDRINIFIVNESHTPSTIKKAIPSYKNLSENENETTDVLAGDVFNSFIYEELHQLVGIKLQQSDMCRISIKDSTILEHLSGFQVENTYGDIFSIDLESLFFALKKRSECIKQR